MEALAAVMGHTQSLHTNSLDEAIALPTDFSARIARNTQLVLQQETGVTEVVDPWGGSYYVEYLTDQLAKRAWSLIEEVEKLGGMAKAIETGLPKLRIEEAAAKKQARIDGGKDIIVGVNRYQVAEKTELELLEVDNHTVRDSQILRLKQVKSQRNQEEVTAILEQIRAAAVSGEGNLLALALVAARKRAGFWASQSPNPIHIGSLCSRSETTEIICRSPAPFGSICPSGGKKTPYSSGKNGARWSR
jgi:methylmalonyl-CoA mutase